MNSKPENQDEALSEREIEDGDQIFNLLKKVKEKELGLVGVFVTEDPDDFMSFVLTKNLSYKSRVEPVAIGLLKLIEQIVPNEIYLHDLLSTALEYVRNKLHKDMLKTLQGTHKN